LFSEVRVFLVLMKFGKGGEKKKENTKSLEECQTKERGDRRAIEVVQISKRGFDAQKKEGG